MTYEIPQQLAYKEKIIFGLTFPQLAYAFIFLPLSLIVFFRTSLPLAVKIILVTNFVSLAVGFMFLNLGYHLKGWIAWYRQRKIVREDKLKAFVGIKEVKDNIIYTLDNRKIAILKIEPVNFSIKPQGTQEAIIGSFQKFLNSLDFPIQIIMNTESLNLSDYFKEIEGKAEKQFTDLFPKYKEHLEKIISQKNILNRSFYLIIPEKHDLEIQLSLCQKKLETIGLKSSRVENNNLKAIIEKFFNYHNKFSSIENEPSFIKVGNTYNKVLFAHGYPRNVEMGFLDKIVSLLGDFDLSLHIEPYDIETMMVNLNRELQKQRADLYAANLKGILNPSLEIKYADTKAILENLQKGKEKLFNVSLYINCRAPTKEALALLARKVES